ncbi:hypothetical protein FHX37_0605 [Haloactinospora alba]|uniref:Uncharacterized protein n=1 Tax=Haloactinospora alba TaxID=405555 RepID=A0A543NFZ7_9ACTN|nr:hypothetical protein FHX37_0605 [Haloactinospora alba]
MTSPDNERQQCASFWGLVPDGETTWRVETTGCDSETSRTWAPGHDGKLKGHLIRWGVAGCWVFKTSGGVVTGQGAAQWGRQLGWPDVAERIDPQD